MILKNLLRRKGRTLLSIMAISLGVAAIISLGTLSNGLGAGYNSMLTGSEADLVLTNENTMDLSYNSVDEKIGNDLLAMPEVSEVTSMLQGIISSDETLYMFVFSYPEGSYLLDRFKIYQGVDLFSQEAKHSHGTPLIMGRQMAESIDKEVGDTIRLSTGKSFRVVGIYETGNAFEDSGSVINIKDAQILLGKQRQVSLFYIRLKDRNLRDRLEKKTSRLWPTLVLSDTKALADKQAMGDMMMIFTWVIAGMAILIGGVGMMNSQLMSVYERTREIGVLRAVGWSKFRVLKLILGETILVSLLGGLLGILLGWFVLKVFGTSQMLLWFGASTAGIRPSLIIEAFSIVIFTGLVGGSYPAWRASRLEPIEALRYEGGSGGKIHRLPFGGMPLQSLWQRRTRTLLTLIAIGLTIASIMVMDAFVKSFERDFAQMGGEAEIMLSQADVADTSMSALDERIGSKIAALPEVRSVDGMMFTAVMLPENSSFFILQGLPVNSFAIRRFVIKDGSSLKNNRQIIIGRSVAEALHKKVGDTIALSNSRFRIVGIFETGLGWEEQGGVVTLRDAQTFTGRPHKVTMYMIKMNDPSLADEMVEKINLQYPEAHAALSSNFANELPDMEATDVMVDAISLFAILIGGFGVMNTMLMSVYERTREIGVLRALGWRRFAVLRMIIQETSIIGLAGSFVGSITALLIGWMIVIMFNNYMSPAWTFDIFIRAIVVSLLLGLVGGIYPAYRATRLQPVEALRYE